MKSPPSISNPLRLTIGNTYDELPRLNQAVQSFLDTQAAPPETVFAAHLAIEEMITNIIKYGYDEPGPHAIEFSLTREPGRLTIAIEDDGHEFNPLNLPPPDTSHQLEKRKIGGLGIHLVRHTVDDIHYQRSAGRNRLTMILRLPDDAGPAGGPRPAADD